MEAGESAGTRRREDVTQADSGSRAGLPRSPAKTPLPAAKVQRRGSGAEAAVDLQQLAAANAATGAKLTALRKKAEGFASSTSWGS